MSLENLRSQINEIDKELVNLLEKRFKISEEIGKYKKENNFLIEDKKREKEIIENLSENSDLSKDFIEQLFSSIFTESKSIQIKC